MNGEKQYTMKLAPDMNYNMDTNILTVMTVFCYVLFVITLQSVAAIMTIVAATSTALWNIYKIIMDRRERKKSHRSSMNGGSQIEHPEDFKSKHHE